MLDETLGGARGRLPPWPGPAAVRHRVIDRSAADGDEWRLTAEDESIARARDDRLVERDAGGAGRARTQGAARGDHARANIGGAQMKSKLCAGPEPAPRTPEDLHLSEHDCGRHPRIVGHQNLAAPQLCDLDAGQRDGCPRSEEHTSELQSQSNL